MMNDELGGYAVGLPVYFSASSANGDEPAESRSVATGNLMLRLYALTENSHQKCLLKLTTTDSNVTCFKMAA